jgi:TPR repeat protein
MSGSYVQVGGDVSSGRQVEKDLREAIRLYKLAAQDGHAEASFALCEIYRYGEDEVRPSLHLAADFAQQSSERGEFLGIVQYADLLANGVGVSVDKVQAQKLYADAHSEKWVVAQNNYAAALETGNGCRQNAELAFEYYGIAARNGFALAMYSFGRCYLFGIGTPKDVVEGSQWFKRSADAGNEFGCYWYALCLQRGEGVAQNSREAILYHGMAAEHGHPGAMTMLGCMYEYGDGVPVDMPQAFA